MGLGNLVDNLDEVKNILIDLTITTVRLEY